MILLFTGAPGWLASSFLPHLIAEGSAVQEIRLLVHPDAKPPKLEPARINGPHVKIVRGSLEDSASLQSAVEGCSHVFHAAALLHPRRTRDLYVVNTEGTRSLAQAASKAGVTRFVMISSNAAAGRSKSADVLLTESMPACPESHYGRSKLLAEEALFEHSFMQNIVLRPCMFYGPPVPSRHIEIYRRICNSVMPLVGGGGHARSLTHVDNLAQASHLALFHPSANGVYYIADEETYTTRQIVESMAEALGVAPRFLHLPAAFAKISFQTDLMLSRMGFYWKTLHLLGESDWHVGVSSQRAQQELGYKPQIGLSDGMKQAIQWCRNHNKIP